MAREDGSFHHNFVPVLLEFMLRVPPYLCGGEGSASDTELVGVIGLL